LSAASGKQFASQDNTRGHGLFTSYLLSGLKGGADANADGAITASELHGYVQTNVSEEASRLLGREQTPELFGNADFVIGRYREAPRLIASVQQIDKARPAAPPAQGGLAPAPAPESAALTGERPPIAQPAGPAAAAPAAPGKQAAVSGDSALDDLEPPTNPADAGADLGGEDADQAELSYWNTVRDSANAAGLRGYLEKFPRGKFRLEALSRIDDLEKREIASVDRVSGEEDLRADGPRIDVGKRLQEALKKAGCYNGQIDGVWGPRSQSAFRSFVKYTKETVATFDVTPDNLKIAEEGARGRVCPAKEIKKGNPQRHVEYDEADAYDDDDEPYDYEGEAYYKPDWRRYRKHGYRNRSAICWSSRFQIVSCDDPSAMRR
jgi:hypothetical protein